MSITVSRATLKEFFEARKGRWITSLEIREELAYDGLQKNISNALSGLYTTNVLEKRKRAGEGRKAVEYRWKARSYKARTKQEDLPLQEVQQETPTMTATQNLMTPEFEILSTSLGKIMADNNNMRAALIKCRDAINQALQG